SVGTSANGMEKVVGVRVPARYSGSIAFKHRISIMFRAPPDFETLVGHSMVTSAVGADGSTKKISVPWVSTTSAIAVSPVRAIKNPPDGGWSWVLRDQRW